MSEAALPRSYLFVPANRPERLDKALQSGADAVIVDLEDAVPPADKRAARESLLAWLTAEASVLVRVNGPDTEWFEDDVRLASHPGVAGIVLPKTERPAHLARVAAHCHEACGLYPIVETAGAFEDLVALARSPRVVRLMFGSLDLQVDLGVTEAAGDELLFFRAQVVLASRLANIAPPVEGVTTVLDDAERIEADTRRGRTLGFRSKLCIHPRQVAHVHRGFAWSETERDWARRVMEAVASSQGAAVAVDGKMVDMPVIRQATEILQAR
ncbi:CoA ester lyase [Imbroritus primus]|uniref:CoA ester lyase n=1 Tax=Imbroritus primus TaxID=3058603 RepID=A0ACD3SQK4_9BURK|nr:CoA ester lyase [Burkholderiaceae bacterium PBA]